MLIWLLSPFTLAMFHAIEKFSCIGVAILPLVLTKTVRIAVTVLSNILVLVRKEIRAVAMPQACSPLSLITIPVPPCMYSISISLTPFPLTYI